MNKKGTFTLTYGCIESNPEVVRQIMARCIIVRAESMYINNTILYHAISEDFEDCPDYVMSPNYKWIITRNDDDSYNISCKKIP
jgi:hypothetical protein